MKPALIKYDQFLQLVQEAAYYRWLNGSSDTEANWYAAVDKISKMRKVKNVDITGKLTEYYREHR